MTFLSPLMSLASFCRGKAGNPTYILPGIPMAQHILVVLYSEIQIHLCVLSHSKYNIAVHDLSPNSELVNTLITFFGVQKRFRFAS
jgi:hypothetical protein